ncbi:MAG: pyrroline-5-carboxylate reductase [Oligoflexia bacterium]|nr:pyrroline-5-carboxylate reductase [Oligoflexia bacterium]
MSMKLGIIGLGKMGEAIAAGLRRSEKGAKGWVLAGTTYSKASATEASKRLGIPCHTDNRKLVAESDILLLCVKPHQAESVLRAVAGQFRSDQLLVSICASITTAQLKEWSGGKPHIVRSMPNTPCLIGEGMTVLSAAPGVDEARLEHAKNIFSPLGKTAVVEESLMDGVTGLSGCGPAYVYLIVEALSEAGVKVGLPRKVATLLAAQTLAGSARMVLERGEHPAALKDEVTTPAGCTIDGLMALEEGKLRVTLIKAVLAASKRSKTLRGTSA